MGSTVVTGVVRVDTYALCGKIDHYVFEQISDQAVVCLLLKNHQGLFSQNSSPASVVIAQLPMVRFPLRLVDSPRVAAEIRGDFHIFKSMKAMKIICLTAN
jgi:hypothetical protein